MILPLIASLFTAFACGILLIRLIDPSREGGMARRALRLFAGGGIGLGIASCLHFIALWAGIAPFLPAIDLGLCLLLGTASFLLSRRSRAGQAPPSPRTGRRSPLWICLAGLFCLELIASAASFVFAFLKEPHGRWDAWLIWNLHARFLFRGGDGWREAFASGLDWSHWDYPLLLPLSIARSWQYMGKEGLWVPAVTAFVFTFLTIGLLWSALRLLRGRTPAILAAMVLLGTPFFIAMGASQFADVPLSFFILLTLVLLALHGRDPSGRTGALVLAGLAAALCAWTKNEGLLFVAVTAAILAAASLCAGGGRGKALRDPAAWLAGALPVLLIAIWFKTQLAPANDLVSGFGPAALAAKLTDPGRYGEIVKAFFLTGLSFTQGLVDVRVGMRINPGPVSVLLLAAYLLLMGVRIDGRDRRGLIQGGSILGLMGIGYFFVYVLTPLDLGYHLATSLNRLFLQMWPGLIFLCFMTAGSPEPDPAPAGKPGTPPGRSDAKPARGSKSRKAGETR